MQRREASQPWLVWLLLRVLLVVLVLAAAAWSILLLHQSRGGFWPLVALAAGALSLVMIGLDVAARLRQRRTAVLPTDPVVHPVVDPVVDPVADAVGDPAGGPVVGPVAGGPEDDGTAGGFVPEPPPAGRRRAHRR